jgi:hypothetical protein
MKSYQIQINLVSISLITIVFILLALSTEKEESKIFYICIPLSIGSFLFVYFRSKIQRNMNEVQKILNTQTKINDRFNFMMRMIIQEEMQRQAEYQHLIENLSVSSTMISS